jgi:hypothetical protein
MKRPHARFNGPGHNQPAPANDNARVPDTRDTSDAKSRAAVARARAARERDRFFALRFVQASLSPVYCVELAAVFGWRVIYARGVLLALEREGLLVSTRRPAPRSGNGRRYFSARASSPSQDRGLDSQKQGGAP